MASSKMDNSVLIVRDINHKSIAAEKRNRTQSKNDRVKKKYHSGAFP